MNTQRVAQECAEAEAGAKITESRKPKLDLLPVAPLIEIAHVIASGTSKRGESAGWQKGVNYPRYFAKVLRHLFAHRSGCIHDAQSRRRELAHAAADLLIMLDCEMSGRLHDGPTEVARDSCLWCGTKYEAGGCPVCD